MLGAGLKTSDSLKSSSISPSSIRNRSRRKNSKSEGLTSKGRKNKLLLLGCFVGACLLSVQPISMMLANLQYYGAKNYLDEWQISPSLVDKNQIANAEQYAVRAIDLHPSFALYTDSLSAVLQWKVLDETDPLTKMELLNEAEELNLTSLQHRPSWPATWANLVYIKWLKNELDDSFQNYLSKASFFGPNSPEVHSVIATIGLSLPERNVRLFLVNKELVKKHLLLGLEHPKAKKAVIDGVLNANKQALVCSWLKGEDVTPVKQLRCA